MIVEKMESGLFRLTDLNGVKDTRTGTVHTEVICKGENIKFFEEA